MKGLIAAFFLMIATIVLGGCSSLRLGQANANLTQLYSDLQTSDALTRSLAQQGLSALAKEAGEAADKDSDPNNKIAFYRIATTAAWQARDYPDVIEYAAAGQALCEPANLRNRDCLMLTVFPSFAVIDETSDTLNREKPGCKNYSENCLKIYQQAFDRYENALLHLIDKWSEISTGSADDIFAGEVARRMGEATCKVYSGVLVPLNGWGSSVEQPFKVVRGQLRELLAQQKSAKIFDKAPNAFDCEVAVQRL